MKHEELSDIFNKLRKQVNRMALDRQTTDAGGSPTDYAHFRHNLTEYEYCQFSNKLESLLDELLTDKQVMQLINLVNKH